MNKCVLLFTAIVVTMFGCSETEMQTDVTPLPSGEDTRFNIQHMVLGSLVPPEEIPVVTIEIVRQDDEHAWWQLTTAPVPIREDLVVMVRQFGNYFVVIPRHTNKSIEFQEVKGNSTYISIQSSEELVEHIFSDEDDGFQRPPLILTVDGYAIEEDFKFSYYHVGTPYNITIR